MFLEIISETYSWEYKYLDFRTVGPNNRLPSGKGPIRSNSGQSCDWLKQYVAVARHSGRKFINVQFLCVSLPTTEIRERKM